MENPQEMAKMESETAVPLFYTNAFNAAVGPYEVVLKLIREEIGDNGQEPNQELLAKVCMSHAHLWTMVHLLDRILNQYIHTVGPISLPADLVARYNLEDEYNEMLEIAKKETKQRGE